MKKSSWILLIVLLGLVALTWYFTRSEDDGMASLVEERKFTVDNISEVQKIFVAFRDKPAYLLERGKDQWTLDGKSKAHWGAVKLMLDVLKDVRIQYVPTPQASKNAVKTFAAHGIKVEAYDKNDNKLISYYIGGVTQSEDGTYFIREDSDQPFVMELPYFTGNLRTRFDVRADDIKHRLIFEEKIDDIQSVVMEYPGQKAESFVINRAANNSWIHKRLDPKLPESSNQMIAGQIENFLIGFKRIGVESYLNSHPHMDSIKRELPFLNISLAKKNQDTVRMSLWPRESGTRSEYYDKGREETYLPRYYSYDSNGDFSQIQELVMTKILLGYSDFYK